MTMTCPYCGDPQPVVLLSPDQAVLITHLDYCPTRICEGSGRKVLIDEDEAGTCHVYMGPRSEHFMI